MATPNAESLIYDTKIKEARDYWVRILSGGIPPSNIALDYERPRVYAAECSFVELKIAEEAHLRIIKLTNGLPFLVYTLLLSSLIVSLKKHTGNSRVVIGSPAMKELGWSNVLAIVCDVNSHLPFRDLLLNVRQILLDAYERQGFPFSHLVRELALEKIENRCPIFDIVASLNEVHAELSDLKNDITIDFRRNEDGIFGLLRFNKLLFDEQSIERFKGHFLNVLSRATESIEAPIYQIDLLSDAERRQVVFEWNDTSGSYSRGKTAHELFEEQVDRTPDHVALIYKDRALTYCELNGRANQLAHYLRAMGIGPDAPVGICMDRGMEMIVGVLGILKAGGAYVPLDPAYPLGRLGYMADDAQVSVLLTQEKQSERLPAQCGQVVCLDSGWSEIAKQSSLQPVNVTAPDNLSYVIYTSGSTGKPKGVLIEHEGLCNLAEAQIGVVGVDENSLVLQYASLSFDTSVSEIFKTLLAGGALCLAEQESLLPGPDLVECLRRQAITIVTLPPAALAILPNEVFSSLQVIISAGEACTSQIVDRWSPGRRFLNGYGPTEATVGASMDECYVGRKPTLGLPLQNKRVYLLDEDLQPVPIGAPGEAYIAGAGLARGYLNSPQMTAERFVPDPFSNDPGARMYKSGDLARRLPDGRKEFLGRLDHQVKIRGFRVETGEIEATLSEHPGVKQAVVVAREDTPGDRRLVAYIAPERKGVCLREPLYRLPNALRIKQINKNETDLMYKEIFQDHSYFKHGITFNPGDCVLDVGANIGLFTLFAFRRQKDLTVYAFEPVPILLEALRDNIALSGLNAQVFESGLSDKTRTATITYYPKMTGMSGLYADPEEDEKVIRELISNQSALLSRRAEELLKGRFVGETFTCQLKTLSGVISENNLKQIDLLKIDVEKSELDVLNGIKDDDWKKIKQIVLELHDINGRLETVTELLKAKEYNIVVEQRELFKSAGLYMIYAVGPSVRSRAPNGTGEEYLDNFPLSTDAQDFSVGSLRAYLSERLPAYMLPSSFVILDHLPVTANGKVDRCALPAPSQVAPASERSYEEPRNELERALASMWQSVLGVDRVGVHDNFFDLGGDSLQSAVFINQLQERAGQFVQVVAIFDAPTIAELTVYLNKNYPDSVQRICGIKLPPGVDGEREEVGEEIRRIDESKAAYLRQLIPSLPQLPESYSANTAKNPSAIFIFCPPRTGSTLLRVMLAGHPRLFAPPSLELLSFNTLEERKNALGGRDSHWLEGVIRALMEIKRCRADEAERIIQECENQQLTTQQFYRLLQGWVGEKKLVDKTPYYALDLEILKRAELYFEDSFYIFLHRHPYGMIHSFEEARLDLAFRYQQPFTARELGELIWVISCQNILEFLSQVPEPRQYRVKFEDLVSHPEDILRNICQSLNLEFYPEMLKAYQDKERKMTDGAHPLSRMLGDYKFHRHSDIDPEVASRWKDKFTEDFLGDVTWELAESLGYPRNGLGSRKTASASKDPWLIEALSQKEDLGRIEQKVDRLSEEEINLLLGGILKENL